MFKDYSTYKTSDFLTDDYFVDSMLNPNYRSERFWKELIDNQKIDVNEFIAAYTALEALQAQKPVIPEERLEIIWGRINNANKLKHHILKRNKTIFYLAIACSVAIIVVFSLFNYIDNGQQEQSITDFAKERVVHTKDLDGKIKLIADNETLEVEGAEAQVEYNADGSMKINKESVKSTREEAQLKNKSTAGKNNTIYNELRVPFGKRAFLTLSDGTSIWVNTGTTVIYPTVFSESIREIYIDGEIYAEVHHDENRPFVIKTDKIDIKVLGTILNITAYREDLSSNVVLVSGLVDVKPKNGKSTIIYPNQMISYAAQASTLTTVNVENFISWKDGVYLFKNEPIENILLKIARYYNVTMRLPMHPSGISCSGKLELKEDLTQLLNGLLNITSMNYGVINNEYKINFSSN